MGGERHANRKVTEINVRRLGSEERGRCREVKRDVSVCVESGWLFGASKAAVQVRSGVPDPDGKVKQKVSM